MSARRLALLALAVVLAVAAGLAVTFAHASEAAAGTPPCVSADAVLAKLGPSAEIISVTAGPSAQKVSDAISARFGKPTFAVVAIAAYVRGDLVAAFGFDAAGCAAVSGTIPLSLFNEARAAAGLEPLSKPPPAAPAEGAPALTGIPI